MLHCLREPSAMASLPFLRCWCFFVAVIFLCFVICCKSDEVPAADPEPLSYGRSMQCFDDGQVYGCCNDAFRLNPSGVINVPRGMVDEYCDGPCLVETEYVLNCVAGMLDNFEFHNGASVEDVRYALRRGCSQTFKRGDFDDLEPQRGDYPDIFGDYSGHGNQLRVPVHLLALGVALLLLVLGF